MLRTFYSFFHNGYTLLRDVVLVLLVLPAASYVK